ncbi:uncharacterized protein KD926_003595 [Aspergillus affinis]|uniref:uncharacterized protein n=1 Tax=Aspergillus affinis TaxID=1070780 RepID=UPI0022FE2170|nr:uncharacterized protein KD926_003595 [Aspergillus affinis]KAI9043444.1 hypothetical protein KD926_003595 [Aspergillus affinis]
MFDKKGSRNVQRRPLPAPRPAAPRTVPAAAPAVVPAVAYRGAYRPAPAVAPRAAPPPSSRGRTDMNGDSALAPRATPRAAPRATPRTTPPRAHGGEEWYKVSTPEFDTVAPDPLDPPKRYHTGIFVETNPKALKGSLFHVTGDIIASSGMRFEVKTDYDPGASKFFHRTTDIGWVRKADFPRIRGILEALPKPTKQQGIDFWTKDPAHWNKLTWTKQNGELYGPGEQRRPIMKCNEWTHQIAIPKLRREGILHNSI